MGRIGRIIVHPTDPNIVYVCALGRGTGPQQERGVYRTRDGGKNWQRVLFVDENTGCSGLTLDAKDPNTLFAGMWQMVMHTYAMYSGGASSGIYVSHDAGTTWKPVLSPGLPKPPLGKIDVAIAPTDSKRVYALIQTADQGSVWRSDDGGTSWKAVNWMRSLIGRAGYYIRLGVGSADANEVFVANSSFFHSTDGGRDVQQRAVGRRQPRHLDRPARPGSHRPHGRCRRAPLDGPHAHVHHGRAADRTDVSRGGGHPGAVLGLHESPGQRHHARAE